MRLLKATDGVFKILVLPPFAVFPGLCRPGIHPERQRRGRVGVTVRKFVFGIGALPGIYILNQIGFLCKKASRQNQSGDASKKVFLQGIYN